MIRLDNTLYYGRSGDAMDIYKYIRMQEQTILERKAFIAEHEGDIAYDHAVEYAKQDLAEDINLLEQLKTLLPKEN